MEIQIQNMIVVMIACFALGAIFMISCLTKSSNHYRKTWKIEEVLPGQKINIEDPRSENGLATVICANNRPSDKKILLIVTWIKAEGGNIEVYHVVDYKHPWLKNFALLNPVVEKEVVHVDEHDIAKLQSLLNEAMDNEDYRKVNELQKKIDKLVNKK